MRAAAALFLLLAVTPLCHALEPIQVSRSAYYVRGESGAASLANRGFVSNAGFVITNEGVVVFDALGTPALGRELLAAIRLLTRQPIRRVIVSHYHADHFYGLEAFKGPGTQIWAHQAARASLHGEAARQDLAEHSRTLAPWVLPDMPLVEPDRWLDEGETFHLGGLTFRVLQVGPAHTPEDLALVLEEERVLFAGDLMSGGRDPLAGEADSKAWIAALDRLLAFEPQVLIGGHGAASYDATADLELIRDNAYNTYRRMLTGEK